jgi:hypothetical protein
MNSRPVNLVLLALNLGLLGTIGYMAYLMRLDTESPTATLKNRVITNTVTQIAVRKVYPTNFLASLGKLPISWNAIESTNYHVYIANLRAIDCPEETIRDIIVTDVAKLYARRRAAVRAQGQPYRFWQTGGAWENGSSANPAMRQQFQELEKEERALVRELLGVDVQTELAKFWNADDEQERMYGFLPEGKRQKVQELQARYDELEQDVYANSKGVMLDQDQEQLKRIQRQKEAELAAVLSPKELEEYELRNSATANSLRSQMSGFEPTEDEFRKVFRLQKEFDQEFNQAFDSTDENQVEVKAKAQQEAQDALNAEIKKTLGDTRYNEWVRAQDGDYKALLQVAERFEIPKETAARVYDMKQDAEQQKQKIDGDPNLTEEQRNNALAAIAKETQKSIAGVMGDKVFKAYQQTGGQWLQNLAQSSAPPPPPEPTTPQPETVAPPFPPPLPFPFLLPGGIPPKQP